MPLYSLDASGLAEIPSTTFAKERIQERGDLQRVLRARIDVLGKDLLVVAEEYALFQDSRRRVDLLALDQTGTLVVIELKRTDDGGHMELQALRYAAMVSTMSIDQLVGAFAHYNGVEASEARQRILDHIDVVDEVEELPNQVRIILVSADFSTEITSTVLWLNANYNTDIRCYRLIPYKLGTEVVLDIQQIIPLPEAAQFQIQQRHKSAAATATRTASSGKDSTKYDLVIGEQPWPAMSKQGSVKLAVQKLHAAGVPLADLQRSTNERRWIAVRAAAEEPLVAAFHREYPERSDQSLWFDLGITEDGVSWVIPRFGGADTESMLTRLAEVATPRTSLSWRRTDSDSEPVAP